MAGGFAKLLWMLTMQAAFMKRYNLAFEAIDAAEMEEVKGGLVQVLLSLNQKDLAADVARGGGGPDLFYKVGPPLPPPSPPGPFGASAETSFLGLSHRSPGPAIDWPTVCTAHSSQFLHFSAAHACGARSSLQMGARITIPEAQIRKCVRTCSSLTCSHFP